MMPISYVAAFGLLAFATGATAKVYYALPIEGVPPLGLAAGAIALGLTILVLWAYEHTAYQTWPSVTKWVLSGVLGVIWLFGDLSDAPIPTSGSEWAGYIVKSALILAVPLASALIGKVAQELD